jgi:predicted RNase H-like HicB family nuclease
MRLTFEIEREAEDRWIAEVLELPGVMTYGVTLEDALGKAQALALRVIAERIEHREMQPLTSPVEFVRAA